MSYSDQQGTITGSATYVQSSRGRIAFCAAPTSTPWTIVLPVEPSRGDTVRFVQTVVSGVADIIFEDAGTGEIGRIQASGSTGGWIEFISTGAQWLASAWGGSGINTP